MIAFVEQRPSGKWLVVLNEDGDLIYTRRVECESKAHGIFSPMVSKEQYDADRQKALLSGDAGTNRNNNVVPLVRRLVRHRKHWRLACASR